MNFNVGGTPYDDLFAKFRAVNAQEPAKKEDVKSDDGTGQKDNALQTPQYPVIGANEEVVPYILFASGPYANVCLYGPGPNQSGVGLDLGFIIENFENPDEGDIKIPGIEPLCLYGPGPEQPDLNLEPDEIIVDGTEDADDADNRSREDDGVDSDNKDDENMPNIQLETIGVVDIITNHPLSPIMVYGPGPKQPDLNLEPDEIIVDGTEDADDAENRSRDIETSDVEVQGENSLGIEEARQNVKNAEENVAKAEENLTKAKEERVAAEKRLKKAQKEYEFCKGLASQIKVMPDGIKIQSASPALTVARAKLEAAQKAYDEAIAEEKNAQAELDKVLKALKDAQDTLEQI